MDDDDADAPAPMSLRRNDSVLHLRGTQSKLVLAMVGLPARGKTYIGRKLSRYLEWLGYRSRVFNIGEYRRERVGAEQPSSFFDPDNAEGKAARERCARDALADMLGFFRAGGHAAVYDGTNSTVERRDMIESYLREHAPSVGSVELVWVESVCNDADLVRRNIMATKTTSPDYATFADREAAAADFRQRIAMYEKAYEPVSGDSQSYVRLTDCGRQVTTNNIQGYLPTRIVFFLMNLRSIGKKPIFFSRHGESVYNTVGRLGGDTPLTERGAGYAERLGRWIAARPEVRERPGGRLPVWCSCLQRTVLTASRVGCAEELVQWHSLNEIDSGTCDGMTYAEVEAKYPHEFHLRAADKLNYRYPEGESYRDLILRLEPVIFELERLDGPILVVAHQAVLRCLLGYFMSVEIEELPHLKVPLHTVLRLVPASYGCEVETFRLETEESVGKGEARE